MTHPSTFTTYVQPSGGLGCHTHTVIFLHGREDYGEDLAQSFFDSKRLGGKCASGGKSSLNELFPSIKWVFPTAKLRYSAQRDLEFSRSTFAEALKGEEIISQWFDIWDIKKPACKQELMAPGLEESIQQILEIVKEESKYIPLQNIILGGISQGCATAIYTLLSSGLVLGGFIGLSSWFPFEKIVQSRLSPSDFPKSQTIESYSGTVSNAKMHNLLDTLSAYSMSISTPIFVSHSRDDETGPFAHGQGLRETAEKFGFRVTWKAYENGGHWIHPQHGVDDISTFIRSVMLRGKYDLSV